MKAFPNWRKAGCFGTKISWQVQRKIVKGRSTHMRTLKRFSLATAVIGLVLSSGSMAFAAGKPLTILESVPGLNFPFFVHMMNQMKAEAAALGDITVIESDGLDQTPKQTADIEAAITKGVDGIVISPREVDAMAPAIQAAVDAGIPVVTIDRRVGKVPGVLGHVGADNVKGGEAQGNLIVKLFPNGATIISLQGTPGASPAIDRNKGLHNVLDKSPDKYKFVFEQTANFHRAEGLSVTESALGGLDKPPQVIVAGNDDMALGAIEALKGRNITGVVVIGFDALPEALAALRDGSLTATVEQFPGGQSRGAVQALVSFLRDNKKPEPVTLLTPLAITKDNIDKAERLGELK
jgi:ABC-type sugar transport system substrate-binding protein